MRQLNGHADNDHNRRYSDVQRCTRSAQWCSRGGGGATAPSTLTAKIFLLVVCGKIQIGASFRPDSRPPTSKSRYATSSVKCRLKHTYLTFVGFMVLKCQEFFQLSGCSTTRGHRFKLMKQQFETFLYHNSCQHLALLT